MELLIRASIQSLRSASQVSLQLTEALREGDNFSWSWGHIKSQFKVKKAEHLFHKYQARLQHALLVLALFINLLISICSGITNIIIAKDNMKAAQVSLILCGIAIFIYILFLTVAHKEHWFLSDRARILVSIVVLSTMCLQTHGSAIIRKTQGKCEVGVRPTYYLVLVNCIMLPYPRQYMCTMSGIFIVILELVLTSVCAENKDGISRQLAAEGIYYLVGGLVGVYIRFIMEMMNRRAFLDRRECLESKIKLQFDKQQEDNLLRSILPDYLTEQVQKHFRSLIKTLERPLQKSPFNKLYIETHNNVSILYADIVNSMMLGASLEPRDLVETLNDLFYRFDCEAEKTHCMRVKLLGDCYYCVSGVPKPDPDHSDNCVQMGLNMIDIIATVREERQVPVDMRIGIHTGRVMCGLIGSKKWQYDIWSKDAQIASHMEQCGKPGHVHITNVTYKHLRKTYNIELADSNSQDAFIANSNVECTYFIRPTAFSIKRNSMPDALDGYVNVVANQVKRPSVKAAPPVTKAQTKFMKPSLSTINDNAVRNSSGSLPQRINEAPVYKRNSHNPSLNNENGSFRRRVAIDNSVTQFRTMISNVNSDMEKAIEVMPLSKKDQWCNPVDINPLFLNFLNPTLEKSYVKQPDPLFKFYLLCIFILFCGTLINHSLVMPWNEINILGYTATFVMIAFGNFATWAGYMWLKRKLRRIDSAPRHYSQTIITRIAHFITNQLTLRIGIWFSTSALLLLVAMLGVEDCQSQPCMVLNLTCKNPNFIDEGFENNTISCYNPWYYTFNAALAMTATSVFLKIQFWVKFLLHFTATFLFCFAILRWESDVFSQGIHFADWDLHGNSPAIGHCYYLIILLIFLHIFDRQVEYVCRLDFICKHKLLEEREEERTTGLANKLLLINILPFHIANHYLSEEIYTDELYYESYNEAAVMFASIPDFTEFYTENSINEEGKRCLQVLNEIICDFDELLYIPTFTNIEKIKTIGSTYMAALGLQPGRGSHESEEEEDPTYNVLNLIKFATAMMEKLSQMNRDLQQDFRLRIGISLGPIIAGVVGSGKPQYDIWGDTVNLASRMDSTGIIGRIQISKEAAEVLMKLPDSPYKCECRGEIFVKGKGMLKTYLVQTLFDGTNSEVTRL